jgi:pimeloyl-ACP methyl ester carboxylesterase
MNNLRTYGSAPFRVALLHGGPGAPGTMAPVARELAAEYGVLEPLQTEDTLDGQVTELRDVLTQNAATPVTLIGSSWGAMLGFILAARHTELVKKLIMVGSGVFEESAAAGLQDTRLKRLPATARFEVWELSRTLEGADDSQKDAAMTRLGELFNQTDTFDPLTLDTEVISVDYALHRRVWEEAVALRSSGELLALGRNIKCPVLALHGDHDPHPAEGIRKPLSTVVADFRFVLLGRCGHLPWLETQARDAFYRRLRTELAKD